MEEKDYKEFIKVFKRIQFNAVYFLDNFYNVVYPDKKIELSDEEKQNLFDEYKGVPFFGDIGNFHQKYKEYTDRIDRLKSEGYQDWEIH